MKKTYTYKNVTYGYNGFNWSFSSESFTLLQKCNGGKQTADKVAHQVHGSLVRTNGKGLDNLGRIQIQSIIGK